MPGFDTEDKNPNLGDPSTQSTTPLTKKQMQGAQQATVSRTQLPSGRVQPSPEHPSTNGQADGQAKDESQQSDQGKQAGDQQQLDPNTPVLGGLQTDEQQ